jgi:hypothetical protein
MVFGDTYGRGWTGPFTAHRPGTNHRPNTGVRSSNVLLSEGVLFDDWLDTGAALHPTWAKALVVPRHDGYSQVSSVPVAGWSAEGVQYMLIDSVHDFPHATSAPTGRTNFATIVSSTDAGTSWEDHTQLSEAPVWQNDAQYGQSFQHGAFVVPGDGYVYWLATRNVINRSAGAVKLARVAQAEVLTKARWVYWDGAAWVSDPDRATDVIPAPADLISVAWNTYLKRWVFLSTFVTASGQSLGWRTATTLEGPWSGMSSMRLTGGCYCPQIHPWNKGPDFYFSMAVRNPYAVFLFHSSITSPPTSAGALP